MNNLAGAVAKIVEAQTKTKKPLAIILAGHNGSGKSTMWRKTLAGQLRIPLINADRMMMSILPEPNSDGALTDWAQNLRDTDESWMRVAQQGVLAFVGHAMQAKVPFAMETVFSHWIEHQDGDVNLSTLSYPPIRGDRQISHSLPAGPTTAGKSSGGWLSPMEENGISIGSESSSRNFQMIAREKLGPLCPRYTRIGRASSIGETS